MLAAQAMAAGAALNATQFEQEEAPVDQGLHVYFREALELMAGSNVHSDIHFRFPIIPAIACQLTTVRLSTFISNWNWLVG